MIRQFKNLAEGMGIKSAIKLILCTIENHINMLDSHGLIKIAGKKLGGDFYIRRNTTDIILAKTIAGKIGEYDFIYSKKFLPFFKNSGILIPPVSESAVLEVFCLEVRFPVFWLTEFCVPRG